MEKNSISVIVPVYNVEQYLSRCIDSLIKQTICVDIILVDDGSTDRSAEICDSYAKEYSNIVVIHKSNGGLGSARNIGIKMAKTEFLGFVDSDDWVVEDMYEHLYDLQKRYNADVVQIKYKLAHEDKDVNLSKTKEKIVYLNQRDDILAKYLLDGMKPEKSYTVCTKLYRKDLFKNINFPEGQLYEDVATNYRILSRAKVYVVSNKPGYMYYVRNGSITKGKFIEKDLDYINVGNEIVELTKNNPRLKKLGIMTLSRFHFMCVCKMMKYKCDTGINWSEQIDISIPVMRKGMWLLLKSKMQLNRKIALILICANVDITKHLIGKINE